jgi:hypothetical protein
MVLFFDRAAAGTTLARLLLFTSNSACCFSSSCATSSKMSNDGLKAGLCVLRIGRRGFAWRVGFSSVVYSRFAVVLFSSK